MYDYCTYRVALYTRLFLSPVGFFIVAYSVSTRYGVNTDLDLVIFYLDVVINVVYLLQSLIRLGGVSIRYKIEKAFKREISSAVILRQSGVLATVVTIMCFAYDISTEVGQWMRLIRLTFIASSILEVFPHIDVLMVRIM
jgi:hypothetical protein